MFDLSNIGPRRGARRARKRIGRGPGSGYGKTGGKGQKGQKVRSGGNLPASFEGGQMPLFRRLPKRGFRNRFRQRFAVVNVGSLADVPADTEVTPEWLLAHGMIPKSGYDGVKLLGEGELKQALKIRVHRASANAKAKVEEAGGSVELI